MSHADDVPAHPLLEGLLGRPQDRAGGCQRPGGPHTPWDAPWRDTAREADKTRLYRYTLDSPEGTPLSKVVADVFGDGPGDYSNTDYQLARRFFERHDCFLIARRGGNLWVEPTPDAFHLTAVSKRQETQTASGSGCQTGRDGDGGSGPGSAKDRAQGLLSSVSTIGSDSLHADMLGELATELESIDGRYNILERIRGTGPEYLLCPYKNRFNSQDRVADLRTSWRRAWRRAADQYDDAVCLTLTTDPGMHDSVMDATASLLENKNRLGEWLAYDPKSDDRPDRPGFRPTNVYALEFTDSGLPHLHVVYFGVRWLTTQAALSRYWGDRQGRVVHVRRLAKRGDRFVMPMTADGDDRDPRTARGYLGKALGTLDTLAGMRPGEVSDAVDRRRGDAVGGGVDLWKMSLYWATGKQFWGGSPSLTTDEADDGDEKPGVDLTHIPCYRFVGSARFENIPGHVRRNAQVVRTNSLMRLPPPP
ncbi:hypothetical protein [Haloarcula sp. 1CSR25-25]|uniref:hypothetical protein n=1 Tax=Haloarcula sp. 1CSR25-25 TaxID=2862545 RepID=UPI002893AFD6|nr:hypothetical protein [Haloarcula sp. 1CSR25-25]MDT3436577.1 hypothetical protein [Haloarcula sp. 1CSR25-25]